MAIHGGDEWQYNQPGGRCLFAVDRWMARFMSETGPVRVKGISEQDANNLAHLYMGRVFRSRVWVFADGSEMLDPWEEVDPWVKLSN